MPSEHPIDDDPEHEQEREKIYHVVEAIVSGTVKDAGTFQQALRELVAPEKVVLKTDPVSDGRS